MTRTSKAGLRKAASASPWVLGGTLAVGLATVASARNPPGAAEDLAGAAALTAGAIYSDTASVAYPVTRACLANVPACTGDPIASSLCQPGEPLTGLLCNAGIHRYCQTLGHRSGWGVENAGNSQLVDVTCVRGPSSWIKSPSHTDLRNQHDGCTSALPSLACSSAIGRYCIGLGFRTGFGPVERNQSVAVVTCLPGAAAEEFSPLASQVAALAPGCVLNEPEVSTPCRRAMHQQCQLLDGTLRGGFGPREVGSVSPQDPTRVWMGCLKEAAWTANAALPESPALPVDILNHRVDPTSGQGGQLLRWDADPVGNTLGAARSFSFDGRLYTVRKLDDPNILANRFVQFRVQTPEIFDEPLSQRQPPGEDTSVEAGDAGNLYDINVRAEDLHIPAPFEEGEAGSRFDTASVAICDPHNPQAHPNVPPLTNVNEQQSVPTRRSNPFACGVSGGVSQNPLKNNHDCYDVTVVGVYQRRYTGFVRKDELWGTPVRVVVANPKRSDINGQPSLVRAKVVGVQVLPPGPRRAGAAGQLQGLLEPSITGNGRVILVQRDGLIQYSVLGPGRAACDVTGWGDFKDIYKMHGDPLMASYGIAKYPLRDLEDNVISTLGGPGPDQEYHRQVRAAYPWIDRDGDNMMFMLGAAGMFYLDSNDDAQSRYEVLGHPVLGNSEDCIPTDDTDNRCIPLRPANPGEIAAAIDFLPRVGLVFTGLWTQGKMFTPDSKNNAADFGVPSGPWHHRVLRLYSDGPGTEVGPTIRTDINSAENQLFFRPQLRPDTPREVVWALSTQYPGVTATHHDERPEVAGGVTDEVDFDDAMDPKALIVSSMNASIRATGLPHERGRFQDGFVYNGALYQGFVPIGGEGFKNPPHLANAASSVSQQVAQVGTGLTANMQWNVPRYGYLLGGARAEPVAAGGFRGKGLWLDGANDRIEYLVPDQAPGRDTEMAGSSWFYTVSIDPRGVPPSGRLLTLPDGSWLDVANAGTLRLGRGLTSAFTVSLPSTIALAPRAWSTLGIVSTPVQGNQEVRVYVDGYLLATHTVGSPLFRMQPGLLTVGAASGGFKGWIDDLKVIAGAPNPEVLCNHARGTLIGVAAGDPLNGRAAAYPNASHQAISDLLPAGPHFPRYACERPIASPTDRWDLADHAHYTCLGQTRRVGNDPQDRCLKHALLFPEGPLFTDLPRPGSAANQFCGSCHVDSHPSRSMKRNPPLLPGTVDMPQDARRQPMQHAPRFFGYVPELIFGHAPATPFPTPPEGVLLDPYTTPSSIGPLPPERKP